MTPFRRHMLLTHGIRYTSIAEVQRWQADAERRRIEAIVRETQEAMSAVRP